VAGVPWLLGLDPRAAVGLARLLRAFPAAVVHVHDAHALTLARWALRWRGRRSPARDPRLIATRHVDFHVRPRSAWHTADGVIAVSQAVRDVLLADGVPDRLVRVIPDGIDPDEVRRAAAAPLDLRTRLGLAPGTPLAVNLAALVDHKDQHTLIRAAAAARSRRPDLHWVIAGRGPLRAELGRAIRGLGLGALVHLVGYIDAGDALIGEADVVVMSSRTEGMGSVVLNALALGRPVVATSAGGLVDVVPAPWRVPVGDAAALAERVTAALDERPVVALPERFTARAVADAVVATYRTLL
jgi:glycosyltransferase involved in cell wall biosynthesis